MIWTGSGKIIHNVCVCVCVLPDNLPISLLCPAFQGDMIYTCIYIYFFLILPTVSRRELVPSICPGLLGSKHRDAIKCAEILQEEMLMWKEIRRQQEEDRPTTGSSNTGVLKLFS